MTIEQTLRVLVAALEDLQHAYIGNIRHDGYAINARKAIEAGRAALAQMAAQECDALASVEGIAQRCAAAIRAREAASCFGLNVVADPTLPSDVAVLRDPTSGKELGRITNIKWGEHDRNQEAALQRLADLSREEGP